MIGKTALHAIKALALLAKGAQGECVGAASLAERIKAPPNYLGKLLQSLAKAGLVEGQKGINGGFRLARDPSRITLFEVVDELEPVSRWQGCFLGRSSCRTDRPCAVHERWGPVRDAYLTFLKETTLADLTEAAD
jgi:Rrf2 family protein